jgi:cytidylate kinase
VLRVAIDGPGGAGKSTLAAALASELGLERLDSGAMYRALALAALRSGLDLADSAALSRLAGSVHLRVVNSEVELEGEDVAAAIRTNEVTRAASVVAAHPGVRAELVARQRAWIAERGGGVVEGRDIGTVVCPDADLKIYLTAHVTERARRRAAELERDTEAVATDLVQRDHHDSTRSVSPLEVAPGAVVIDTTNRSVSSLVEQIVGMLR